MSLHEPIPIYAFKFVIYERLEGASKDSTICNDKFANGLRQMQSQAVKVFKDSSSIQLLQRSSYHGHPFSAPLASRDDFRLAL